MQRITSITAYRVVVPLEEGTYTMSGGRALDSFDSTIVAVATDGGLTGWGEYVPLGATYLPAYAEGARAGIREIAPALIGQNPLHLNNIADAMDVALMGHPYAKSAIDMACWDLLGKAAGLPLHMLLGGRFGQDIALYRSITQGTPSDMADLVRTFREQGYRHFQLKVGGEPMMDIERIKASVAALGVGDTMVADANGGWQAGQAARVVRAIGNLDIAIEQPCRSYEECATVRRRCTNPFILDESIDSLPALLRGLHDGAMDGINLKISKVGGLTRARVIRDVCVAHRMPITIEDTACTDIGAAAVAHLAHSTPAELRQSVTLANIKLAVRTADGAPQAVNGRATTSQRPGLGVEPIMDMLGTPLLTVVA